MRPNILSAAATSAALSLAGSAAYAGADDYVFEPVQAELTKGDDVTVAVRLVHKPTGKPVAYAVIFRTRIDMGPDGMAEMVSPVIPLPAKDAGTYAFKTDLPMPGRYMFSLAAKIQGEPETVVGKVMLKAKK
ncbi:MAG: FixH family protein [Rhodoplanes sp.]